MEKDMQIAAAIIAVGAVVSAIAGAWYIERGVSSNIDPYRVFVNDLFGHIQKSGAN
jgi:hypothetical protein